MVELPGRTLSTLTAEIPLFSGSELVFLDVPKVRDVLINPTIKIDNLHHRLNFNVSKEIGIKTHS
jgi:hypothetical protein